MATKTEQQWFVAAKQGNLGRLVALAATKINKDKSFSDGETALGWCAGAGDAKTLGALLRLGCNPNLGMKGGLTPLMRACASASPQCVKLLLEAGARTDARSPGVFGKTAARLAVEIGCAQTLSLLAGAGCDLEDVEFYNGTTLLMVAGYSGHEECARVLAKAGAKLEAMDRLGCTALMIAVEAGMLGCVDALVEAGADLEARGGNGRTALMIAAESGRHEVVALLLSAGSDSLARGGNGWTAIHFAAMHNDADTIKAMLDFGVSTSLENDAGIDAVAAAMLSGAADALTLLLKAGASLECALRQEGSPQWGSAIQDCARLVKIERSERERRGLDAVAKQAELRAGSLRI